MMAKPGQAVEQDKNGGYKKSPDGLLKMGMLAGQAPRT